MKMTARKIVEKYSEDRMSARPEYYSGRGATLSDLNPKLLEMIYQGIRREIAATAAEEFIQMVENIDVLSATLFLNSLYALEANGWVWWKPRRQPKAMDHIDVGPEDGSRLAVGLASIASWAYGGSNRDDTLMIRTEFLTNHGHQPKMPKAFRNYYS